MDIKDISEALQRSSEAKKPPLSLLTPLDTLDTSESITIDKKERWVINYCVWYKKSKTVPISDWRIKNRFMERILFKPGLDGEGLF